jgi:hypothetical protein
VVAATRRPDRGVELGVRLRGSDAGPDVELTLEVKRYTTPVTPSALASALEAWRAGRPGAGAGLLVVTPTATPETLQRAAELGISLIALNRRLSAGPRGHLALAPGDVVPLGGADADDGADAAPGRRGVPAWGELRIVKALLLLAGRTQSEIARQAGVSQPRVSQVLKGLRELSLVRATSPPGAGDGSGGHRLWEVTDWGALLRHWLDQYPGPGGVTTYWLGLEPLAAQARAVVAVLGEADDDARPLVSGDVAADLVAPWARPARTTVYARHGADLGAAGLTPSPGPDATLALVVPEDAGVWLAPERFWNRAGLDPAPGGLPLADPLQVLDDVRRSPSVDADQAAETLLRRIEELHARAAAADLP